MSNPNVARSIVVIGASSGGVEALQTVVGGLPEDLRAAVFIVLHTSPSSPAVVAQILARVCRLPVKTAVHGEPIPIGEVRVAPPDQHLVLTADRVELDRGPKQNRVRPAIDALFRSAAMFHGPAVIGVVLTGNLSDGSAGLAAITHCGGVAIVQAPGDAMYPDMPRNAIEADSPQFVVPLVEVAGCIVKATREAGEVRPVPESLAVEAARGLHLGPTWERKNDRIGQRAALTCTDCGGPLWKVDDDEHPRFRCLLGHTFDESVLLGAKTEEALRALWIAVRTLDERARMLSDMADSNRLAHRNLTALQYSQRQDELLDAARAVRELMRDLGGDPSPPEPA